MVAGIASLVSVPAGLGAAIYMSEYAGPREREFLKPILEILAGIPSVVFGFFALKFITPWILKPMFSLVGIDLQIFNTLSAGIVVGIMVTPLIASLSEDVIRSVPRSLREAAFALGSTRFDVSVRIVVPAALSGILAAFLLAFSRAIGETMVAAMAGGRDGSGPRTLNPLEPGLTMTAAMTNAAGGTDQVNAGAPFQVLFFVGLLLFMMTMTLNVIGDRFVQRVRQQY